VRLQVRVGMQDALQQDGFGIRSCCSHHGQCQAEVCAQHCQGAA
jgi:hypothetical protein